MVIVVGNEHADQSSNSGQDFVFHVDLIHVGTVRIHLFSHHQWVFNWLSVNFGTGTSLKEENLIKIHFASHPPYLDAHLVMIASI